MESHKEQVMLRVQQAADAALEAAGEAAVDLVRERMQQGYDKPIRQTGALMADVQWAWLDGKRIRVGNTLPYAPRVHQERPYLRDAVEQGAPALEKVMQDSIGQRMKGR